MLIIIDMTGEEENKSANEEEKNVSDEILKNNLEWIDIQRMPRLQIIESTYK